MRPVLALLLSLAFAPAPAAHADPWQADQAAGRLLAGGPGDR